MASSQHEDYLHREAIRVLVLGFIYAVEDTRVFAGYGREGIRRVLFFAG